MENQKRTGNIYMRKGIWDYFICVEMNDKYSEILFLHANSFDLSVLRAKKKLIFGYILPEGDEHYDPDSDENAELVGHAESNSSAILDGEDIDLILPRGFKDRYKSLDQPVQKA